VDTATTSSAATTRTSTTSATAHPGTRGTYSARCSPLADDVDDGLDDVLDAAISYVGDTWRWSSHRALTENTLDFRIALAAAALALAAGCSSPGDTHQHRRRAGSPAPPHWEKR